MKKGFTLIELLAVIIILAIIVLIATPIVLDVVDDAKNSAAKSEASMIVSGVNNYCAAADMKEQLTGEKSICKDADGVTKEDVATMVDLGNAKVNSITYDGKVTSLEVESNNRIVSYDGKIYTIDGEIIDTPEIPNYTEELLNGADPELNEGMIPVVIANDGSLTKADLKSEWYKYEDKKWANVVLVTESSRDSYLAAEKGLEIKQEDVIAYYVWIPRYKYQIFSDVNNLQFDDDYETNLATSTVINIVFEDKNKDKSLGSNKDEWLTHPAFTFGSDELNGIWVGKFELTGNTTTPTILPNQTALITQSVLNFFKTSLKFTGNTLNQDGTITHSNNTTYGINNMDSHIIKNIEWGAVAYLTNSNYGRCSNGVCEEVRLNNSSTLTTGCAATVPATTKKYGEYKAQTDHSEGYYHGCENEYTTSGGVLASTTGNVTGIYDMSGGSWEYVMGVMEDSLNSGVPSTGRNNSLNSGFTGNLTCPQCDSQDGNDPTITNIVGTNFPESKYYDIYLYGTTRLGIDAYSRGKLGDATLELGMFNNCTGMDRCPSKWNQDYFNFININFPWFIRGGEYYDGAGNGIFAFSYNSGDEVYHLTSRSVLVK